MEVLVLIFATVLGTVVGTVLALEAWSSVPHVGRALVRSTIEGFPAAVPEEQRQRWGEELEADFLMYDERRLAGLAFAIRLRVRGGRSLAGELALVQLEDAPARPGEETATAAVTRVRTISHRRQLEDSLGELTIRELAMVAKEETGLSLEQLAAPSSSQRHRTWRSAVQHRLAAEMISRCRRSASGEGER